MVLFGKCLKQLYKPIEQQAVLLKDSPVKKSNRYIGREFLSFVKSDESLRVIFMNLDMTYHDIK